MVALSALVSGLDAELVRLGCKDPTMALVTELLASPAEVLRCPRRGRILAGPGPGPGPGHGVGR